MAHAKINMAEGRDDLLKVKRFNRVFPKWISLNSVNQDKSKSGMDTKGITHLLIDTLPVIVI